MISGPQPLHERATREQVARVLVGFRAGLNEASNMPVLILWALPAVVVIGGVGYFLVHAPSCS